MVCSNFWKLDKIDKIVISLIFIVVSMFSLFSCFCFASSPVPVSVVNNLTFSQNTFSYSDTNSTGYYKLIVGHKYRVKVNIPSPRNFYYSNEEPSEGVKGYFAFDVEQGENFEFVAEQENLFISSLSSSLNAQFNWISVEDLTVGYDAVITDLFYNVGFSQLWSVFETSIPWVLVVVLFVFGWWFFSHWVKELGKGREF